MPKKKLLLVLILISSVFAFVYLQTFNNDSPPETNLSQNYQTKNAIVEIEFTTENVLSKEIEVDENSTAYSLLYELTQEENIALETTQYDFGVFIEAINEHESSAERAWIYYVNGTSGDIAADQKRISENDLVEWKYIKPNE